MVHLSSGCPPSRSPLTVSSSFPHHSVLQHPRSNILNLRTKHILYKERKMCLVFCSMWAFTPICLTKSCKAGSRNVLFFFENPPAFLTKIPQEGLRLPHSPLGYPLKTKHKDAAFLLHQQNISQISEQKVFFVWQFILGKKSQNMHAAAKVSDC